MKRWILLLLLLPLLTGTASAAETTELLMELPEDVRQELADFDESQDFTDALRGVLRGAVTEAKGTIGKAAALAASALGIVLLCAVVGSGETGGINASVIAGALGILGLCAFSVQGMAASAAETLQSVSEYSALLLPALSAAAVASGGVSAAPVIYTATVIGTQLTLRLMTKLLLPLVYLFLALAAAQATMEQAILSRLKALLGSVISGALKTVLTIFTAYLSLSGLVSGAADAMRVKAMKAAVSGTVPVVGSILSDASETVLVSAGILKNSVGTLGMLAILALVCAPFLRIAVQYLILKLTAALSAIAGDARHTQLLGDIATALGFLLALMGVFSLMLLICVVCFLRASGG